MIERYERELEKIIKEEMDKEVLGLAKGSVTDWSDYQRRVGRIEGLAKIIEYAMTEARKETYKEI